MAWKETCAVDERLRFVLAVELGEETMAALCRGFGVSRRTGYKWLGRYRESGVAGLADRSRAPLARPHGLSSALAERCLGVRRAHPTWGPVKVRAWLSRQEPAVSWPAASTIGALFDREGLTVRRRRRRRVPPSSAPFAACDEANAVWSIDFKGWFLTGDGTHCEPLTLSDAYSRYLLRCQALERNDGERVWAILDAAFREHGLPLALRSDNGPPFAARGAGGLSRLAVRLLKAGVTPERIAPGKPQQNGRHERLHLTLKQDTASPPAEHYAPSPRRWDGVLRAPDYPEDHEIRRVRHSGEIKWRGKAIYVSQALTGEPVGLAETDGGAWALHYGPIPLGLIEHRGTRLKRPRKPAPGLVDKSADLPTTPEAQSQQQRP